MRPQWASTCWRAEEPLNPRKRSLKKAAANPRLQAGSSLQSRWCESVSQGCRSWSLASTGDRSKRHPGYSTVELLKSRLTSSSFSVSASGCKPIGQNHPQGRPSPSICWPTRQSFVEPPTDHPEGCFSNLGFLIQEIDFVINSHGLGSIIGVTSLPGPQALRPPTLVSVDDPLSCLSLHSMSLLV